MHYISTNTLISGNVIEIRRGECNSSTCTCMGFMLPIFTNEIVRVSFARSAPNIQVKVIGLETLQEEKARKTSCIYFKCTQILVKHTNYMIQCIKSKGLNAFFFTLQSVESL